MQVTLHDDYSGEITTVDMHMANLLGPQQDAPANTKLDTLNTMLFIKDSLSWNGSTMSNNATALSIEKVHCRVEQTLDMYPTPNGTCGI